MQPLHLVFGFGQVGRLLVVRLLQRGLRVRVVCRSAVAHLPPEAELMRGDASDAVFARQAAAGAAVVYNCVVPPYDQWSTLLAPLSRNILAAASAAGARLVVLDNVYMYGPSESPLTERTPMQAQTRKGKLRAELAEMLFAAHARGDVQATSGRASDYFGPESVNTAVLSARCFQRLLSGRKPEAMVDADQPHAFSYTPDVADGLVMLGTRAEAVGRAWHLPVSAARLTQREFLARFARQLGGPEKCATLPGWLFRFGTPFSAMFRELAEMEYQWTAPFLVDDSDFCRTFGARATPIDQAVRETAQWARRTYGVAQQPVGVAERP